MNTIMPSPYREMLMNAKKMRINIDDIIAEAKKAHPQLFVTAEEERLRDWKPRAFMRKEVNHGA